MLAGAAAASAAAGVIHLAAVPEHWGTYRAAGVFFIAIGTFQVLWGTLVLGRPSRALYATGAAAALLTIGLWAVSRTTGIPFGPFAGVPEPVGRADVIATVLEEVTVVAIILLASAHLRGRTLARGTHRAGLPLVVGVTAALTGWALAAMHAGEHVLNASGLAGRAGAAAARASGQAGLPAHLLGHHGLHLLFAGGAVALYFLYVVAHVRRYGWPSFSWRLNP